MSRSLNKVMLIGNVGADPEIRTTPSGTKLAKVSLATNRSFRDRSGQTQAFYAIAYQRRGTD